MVIDTRGIHEAQPLAFSSEKTLNVKRRNGNEVPHAPIQPEDDQGAGQA